VVAHILTSIPAPPTPVSARVVGIQAIKSTIVMAFLLVGFRLFGKREMSQLTVYDLAMLFAVSNAVQNAMTGGRGNIAIGLATSATVVIVAWAIGRVLIRAPKLEVPLLGSPTILVSHGQVVERNLRRQRVSREQLAAAIRSYGLVSPDDVSLAVLEVDGSISVVPRPGQILG
jgi:uncharacterized membrane protein YcaP (DUF421 family)